MESFVLEQLIILVSFSLNVLFLLLKKCTEFFTNKVTLCQQCMPLCDCTCFVNSDIEPGVCFPLLWLCFLAANLCSWIGVPTCCTYFTDCEIQLFWLLKWRAVPMVYIGSAPYMCRPGHIEVVVYQLPVPTVHRLQQLVMGFMEPFPSNAMKTLAWCQGSGNSTMSCIGYYWG